MSHPGLNKVNKHLEDNQLLTVEGFCEAACEVFSDNTACRETISTFKAQPFDSERLDDVRHLLRHRAEMRESEEAYRLVLWCGIFPKIVEEMS